MKTKLRTPTLPWSSLATLALLRGIVIACSSSGAPSNRLLEDLLNARTVKESNDAFFAHGPIREEELPLIFEATSSSTDYRRRNAAQEECAYMLSFMPDGKNPVDNFAGRVRGKDAVAFAENWLKEPGG